MLLHFQCGDCQDTRSCESQEIVLYGPAWCCACDKAMSPVQGEKAMKDDRDTNQEVNHALRGGLALLATVILTIVLVSRFLR